MGYGAKKGPAHMFKGTGKIAALFAIATAVTAADAAALDSFTAHPSMACVGADATSTNRLLFLAKGGVRNESTSGSATVVCGANSANVGVGYVFVSDSHSGANISCTGYVVSGGGGEIWSDTKATTGTPGETFLMFDMPDFTPGFFVVECTLPVKSGSTRAYLTALQILSESI
jgi:hypothetical protein